MANSARLVGILLVLCGILGIGILSMDQVLRGAIDPTSGVPLHYYALIVFVVLDFVFAGVAFAKPTKGLALAAGWSLLRIIIQLADLSQAHTYMFRYTQFADYLFNPTSSLSTSFGNPPGVPAIFIDLILLFELIIVMLWKKGSSSSKSTTTTTTTTTRG
jgi:hypothetical protein